MKISVSFLLQAIYGRDASDVETILNALFVIIVIFVVAVVAVIVEKVRIAFRKERHKQHESY